MRNQRSVSAYVLRVSEIGEDYLFLHLDRDTEYGERDSQFKPQNVVGVKIPHFDSDRLLSTTYLEFLEGFDRTMVREDRLYRASDEQEAIDLVEKAKRGEILFLGESPIRCVSGGTDIGGILVNRERPINEHLRALAWVDKYRALQRFMQHGDRQLFTRECVAADHLLSNGTLYPIRGYATSSDGPKVHVIIPEILVPGSS